MLFARVVPYIFLGWVLTKLKFAGAETLVKHFINFALYILIPLFTFFMMWAVPVSASLGNTRNVVIAVLVVFFAGVLFSVVHSKIFNESYRAVALPIIFMNTAYLAIPLNTIFFGQDGTYYSVVYNIVLTILTFTYGIWLVAGTVKEVFRVPVLYFAVLGVVLSSAGIKLSEGLIGFSRVLNAVTMPIMLCLVGYQLRTVKMSMLKKTAAGVFMRMFGGLAVAYLFCIVFSVTGIVRDVCLLSSAMPSAILAYILNKKYDADYSFASSMITVGMFVTIIIVPVILWLR